MQVSAAYPLGALSAGDGLVTSWGIAVVIRTKLIKLVINKTRPGKGVSFASPPQ